MARYVKTANLMEMRVRWPGFSDTMYIYHFIIYLPRTHTTQRARRTNSIWQVWQGWSTAL